MIKQKEPKFSNARIAVVFFVFLAFVIGISIVLKVVSVVRAGQFDASKRFTIAISNGHNVEVMSLSSGLKDIVIFKLNDSVKPAEAGRLLEIPVDGFIALNSLDLNQKVSSLFVKTIFSFSNLKTNLTIIDLAKLAMLARTIPENSVTVKTVRETSAFDSDKIVGRLVVDTLVEKDRQTIQIINRTDVGGLGNRLAKFVTNMGGNVIIVATGNSPAKKSTISYIDKKTYTVDRLQKVLGYEVRREANNAISDITIAIGGDGINDLPF